MFTGQFQLIIWLCTPTYWHVFTLIVRICTNCFLFLSAALKHTLATLTSKFPLHIVQLLPPPPCKSHLWQNCLFICMPLFFFNMHNTCSVYTYELNRYLLSLAAKRIFFKISADKILIFPLDWIQILIYITGKV